MDLHQPRIVVVGTGVLGSAVAYNLAIRGADVLLVDQGTRPASGVTGRAFGWVNVINGEPEDASYALWREAIAEYPRLQSVLPEAFMTARAGSLVWKATPQETEQFAARHRQAGEDVVLLPAKDLAVREPHLRRVPECAVFSRNDIALDPVRLTETLVAAAIMAGASVRSGAEVSAIETTNGRVSGVRIADDVHDADIVVLAAGSGLSRLLDGLGIEAGLTVSPALLLRYACSIPLIRYILRGPRLEVRQAADNTLLVAKSYVADGDENGPRRIGERMLDIMRDELHLPADVVLARADIGNRPIFADGLPRLGFLPQVDGLYLAAGHPGVILAPLLGCLSAEEICDGQRAGAFHDPDERLRRLLPEATGQTRAGYQNIIFRRRVFP